MGPPDGDEIDGRKNMLRTILTILLFLLMLTVIICLHEAGHLLAAKKFGVYCYEYSFGMGPVLRQWQKGETLYSIRALPIGGFVAMAGETEGDEAYPNVAVPDGRRLTQQKTWKRIVIMLAGIFMNFVLAYVIFCGLSLYSGRFAEPQKPIIQEVLPASSAARAGLQTQDEIIKITFADGYSKKIRTFSEISYALLESESDAITVTVKRNVETVDLPVTLTKDEETGTWRLGIRGPQIEVKSVNLLNCWKYGGLELTDMTRTMLSTLKRLLHGSGFKQLSGPVGIYRATQETVSLGLVSYIYMIGLLSLNVGIFNLLPLPVLDGGQVVLTLAEHLYGKPLNARFKTIIMIGTWILLLGLMVAVTWNDVLRLLR